MGRPWAELSSAERMDAILMAVHELNIARDGMATGSAIALQVGHDHPMDLAGWGKNSTRNGLRRMSTATRVTPGITALRKRGLLTFTSRSDGLSGSADALTEKGFERVRELLRERGGREALARARRPPEGLSGDTNVA